jgi:cyclopropane-fatty-acyl-phospholipid synthase
MILARFLNAVIKAGDLHLTDAVGNVYRIGDRTGQPVGVRIHSRATEWRMLFNPKLAVGEAYMDGRLTIEDGTLYDFLDLAARNLEAIEGHRLQVVAGIAERLLRYVRMYNPIGKAQRNVAHHYDLSDELYRLFLDADRQYSCAYFSQPGMSLEAAQLEKKRHIAGKLRLDRPGLRALDIGSGWGGMALYLAQQGAATVKGVTLSVEQHKVSEQRARDADLDSRVRFSLQDYRTDTGKYDRIVSVGMFEHVGAGHYLEYFRKIRELLDDEGVFLLHSIGRMEPPGTTNPWLRKYIFPGGYTPALSEVLAAIEKAGLWVTDIEILRLHYAETLREWHDRFQDSRDKARDLYDERFCRMWEYYLVGCEVAFRRMGQMVFQIQITKRQDVVPLTRDYMTEWDRSEPEHSSAAAE